MREVESLIEESKKMVDEDYDAGLTSGDDSEIVGPVGGKSTNDHHRSYSHRQLSNRQQQQQESFMRQ
jgi:hypothetical protein